MRYETYKKLMEKNASMQKDAGVGIGLGLLVTGLLGGVGTAIAGGYQAGTNAALIHLGTHTALGLGGGALLAQALSKGQQDISDIKKEYEAERLKTDIGEMQAKINQESRAKKRMQQPVQSMRLT